MLLNGLTGEGGPATPSLFCFGFQMIKWLDPLKLSILIVSLLSITAGYYLLYLPLDAPHEEIVKRVWQGMTLAIVGGFGNMIFILKINK